MDYIHYLKQESCVFVFVVRLVLCDVWGVIWSLTLTSNEYVWRNIRGKRPTFAFSK